MPLSEEELRMLEQMERALVEEDPKLASTLRGTAFQRAARTRAIVAGVVFLGGVALLLGGAIWHSPVVGVIGFVVMLTAATVGVTALRAPATVPADGESQDPQQEHRQSGHPGLGVVDGGKRHRPRRHRPSGTTMMDRLEERWRHRRERGM